MIKNLSIRNLLLIERIDLDFSNGLCVLTGETGAGKSMIIDSLNLISGGRMKSSSKPRNGKLTTITALVEVDDNSNIKKDLLDLGIESDKELLIRRTINSEGKSKSFINDSLVSLSILKKISTDILEIHSQFSEQGLLDSSTHIETLDDYGKYKNELERLKNLWVSRKISKEQLEELQKEFTNNDSKKEKLEYDLNELKLLDPKEKEFEELSKKRLILKNSAKISENLNNVVNNFYQEDPPGIITLLSGNIRILSKVSELLDPESKKMINNLESLYLEINEISEYFSKLADEDFDPRSLDMIEEKIESYKKISKKHNVNFNELPKLYDIIKAKIQSTFDIEKKINDLQSDFEEKERAYVLQSQKLSDLRREFAKKLDHNINQELPQLKLENAVFETFFEDGVPSEKGFDKIIFKIKTNINSQMDTIKNISSGGELCRIALAIKVIAEEKKNVTMIFDEVDSGIGGAVSSAVGERLRKLGENKQVLVVTHSPQVAAFGHDHFIVKKTNNPDQTSISVSKLNHDEKINEIARMLSGKNISKEAIDAAKKLMFI